MTPEQLDQVVDRLYASVLAPDEWRAALQSFTDLLGGSAALAFVARRDSRKLLRYDTYRIDPEAAAAYDAHWAARDIRWTATQSAPAGQVFTEETVLDRAT